MKRNALAASLSQALFCAVLLPVSLAATAQINNPGNAKEFAASMAEQVRNMDAVAKVVGMKRNF